MADRWRIVDVDSMPWPHNPFKRRWVHRFKSVLGHGASIAELAAARDADMALNLTPASRPLHVLVSRLRERRRDLMEGR